MEQNFLLPMSMNRQCPCFLHPKCSIWLVLQSYRPRTEYLSSIMSPVPPVRSSSSGRLSGIGGVCRSVHTESMKRASPAYLSPHSRRGAGDSCRRSLCRGRPALTIGSGFRSIIFCLSTSVVLGSSTYLVKVAPMADIHMLNFLVLSNFHQQQWQQRTKRWLTIQTVKSAGEVRLICISVVWKNIT